MATTKPDYGIDAPAVLRNLFLFGFLCLVAWHFIHGPLRIGNVVLYFRSMFFWTGVALIVEGFLYLLYVKVGKFHHRDFILNFHTWTGGEQVLDVGCGRGLLLCGAAKRIASTGGGGHATGIDIWSTVDMGGNAQTATQRNIDLESLTDRCTLVSAGAQQMPFPDAHFDVIVSNLCLHNIYDAPTRHKALAEIVRVLKPGGQALISDYKLTSEYAKKLSEAGFEVRRERGTLWTAFPPLDVVIARKPPLL
jgi:SAM-dependent methyltransferase